MPLGKLSFFQTLFQGLKLRLAGHQCDQKLSTSDKIFRTGRHLASCRNCKIITLQLLYLNLYKEITGRQQAAQLSVPIKVMLNVTRKSLMLYFNKSKADFYLLCAIIIISSGSSETRIMGTLLHPCAFNLLPLPQEQWQRMPISCYRNYMAFYEREMMIQPENQNLLSVENAEIGDLTKLPKDIL